MKIAIVGTGAMGSVYAGLLGAAGNEVWAIDIWAEHIDAIASHGLRVSGASGDRVVHVNAATETSAIGPAELVVIATKAMHVQEAALLALPLIGPETAVLPIQNGLGSADVVAEIVGEDKVVLGVVGAFGSSIVAPGHVHHAGLGLLRLGERRGPVSPRVERLAGVWRAAGFNVATYDDADQLVWEKLICNVAFSGTCAVLDLMIGEVIDDPNAWLVASGCAVEAHAVALAHGIRLEFDDPVEYVAAFGAKIASARPSMLLDLRAGNPCEVDVINGAIPPRARTVGLAAPLNETVTALVKAREAALLSGRGSAAAEQALAARA